MSTSSRRGGHQTLIGSSISRAIDALFRQPIQWVAVLRLVFGTALALVLAYSINVSGGFVTVLGVLFIPFMPHNLMLGLGRLLAGAVACGGGWLVAYQFVEQPWLLIPLVAMNAFLFFYLLARGLPLMIMLIIGLFPIAIAWMLMVGKTGSDVVTLFLELECGILASEVVCLIWPKTATRDFRDRLSQDLLSLKDDYRTVLDDSDHRGRVGKVRWNPARSLGLKRVAQMMRSERGAQDPELSRLISIGNHIKYLLSWPSVYQSFVPAGRFDKWMNDLRPVRESIHASVYPALTDLAKAVRSRRPAADLTALDDALLDLNQQTDVWLEKHHAELPVTELSLPLLRCDLGVGFQRHMHGIQELANGAEPPDPTKTGEIAPTIIQRVTTAYDPRAALFAFRATLCPLVALMVAMAYPGWSGALILVLLSGFLAPISLGGIAMMFVDRILGLLVAGAMGLIFFVFLMPDLVDIGIFLLALSLFALPFLILTVNPSSVGIGLSGAMAIYFMLTGANNPQVSLDPIQARLLSVGGATFISYMVFTLVFPIRAVNTVGGHIAQVLDAMAGLLERFTPSVRNVDEAGPEPSQEMIDRHRRTNEQQVWIGSHKLVDEIESFDQVVSDLQWEIGNNRRYGELRLRMLMQVNLLAPILAGMMFQKVRMDTAWDEHESAQRAEARRSLFQLIRSLSRYAASDHSPRSEMDDALAETESRNREFARFIEEQGYASRLSSNHPDHLPARSMLVEHAYVTLLIREFRRTRQLLVMRRMLNLTQRGHGLGKDF